MSFNKLNNLLFSFKHGCLWLLFMFFSSISFSQEVKTTRDIGLWLDVGAHYEFSKDWTLKFKQGFRTFNNAVSMEKSLTDLGIDYKINRNFRLGAGVRYEYARKSDFSFRHNIRYDLDFKFRSNLTDKFQFEYRLKYQHRYANLFTYYKDVKQKSNLRNRIKFKYKLSKNTLYFTSELFREFAHYKKPKFNNLRMMLGDEVGTKLGDLDFALAYEVELNESYPLHFFFLSIGYTFKLKHD